MSVHRYLAESKEREGTRMSCTETETEKQPQKSPADYHEGEDSCGCGLIIFEGNGTVVMRIPGRADRILPSDEAEEYNKMFHWW